MERLAIDVLEDGIFSILLNGSPRVTFKSKTAISDDFHIGRGSLNSNVSQSSRVGIINGFKVNEKGFGIPTLQYADDTLVLINGKLKEALAVKNILILFEACSSLNLNAGKSILY